MSSDPWPGPPPTPGRTPLSEGFVRCPLCGQPEREADVVGGVCLTCAEGITWSLNARRAAIPVEVEKPGD